MKPSSQRLTSLFPLKIARAEDIEGTPPELFEYRRDFGGQSWDTVKADTYNYHSDAYCLMDPETLSHFIAGFLRTALEDPKSVSSEFLVYFGGSNGLIKLSKFLSMKQITFVIEVIDHLLMNDSYFSISNAVQYDKIRAKLVARHSKS